MFSFLIVVAADAHLSFLSSQRLKYLTPNILLDISDEGYGIVLYFLCSLYLFLDVL